LTAARSQGGELKLVNVSQPVHEILRITRLATLFDIEEDDITGAASFRASV
jgi:anti-anti-sigma regulatory factor